MSKKPVIDNLLTLSVDSIKDFQTCARLYDYRHAQGLRESIGKRELMAIRFENTLKKVVSFFFYKKQGGTIPSYAALLNRWERLWFPKEMTAYDLAVEQHESAYGNLSSYSNDAAAALLKFYEDFTNDPSIPILIDEEFVLPLKREVRLSGSLDLVLRKDGGYQVIKWSAKSRRPSMGSLVLDFAAQKAAFDYRNHERRISAEYGLYDLASAKPGFVPFEVGQEDINALMFWANEAFEEEVYPSRRGLTHYCKSCPFDKMCSTWKEWPDQ